MGYTEEIEIEGKKFTVFSRLPYRVMCELEARLMGMFQNFEENPFESLDPESDEMDWSVLKKLDIRKKNELCDFLIVSAVVSPKLIAKDLDNSDHELNGLFKPLGDVLFTKYMELYAQQATVKKKSTS